MRVLSIDAWAGMEKHSWEWNNWSHVGDYLENAVGPLTEESALRFFKSQIIDDPKFDKKYEIEDDQYNLILVEKRSRRPLYAIEYGNQE